MLLMLGSNFEAERQLEAALLLLRQRFELIQASGRHWTEAAGEAQAPAYLNQAVVIRSELDRHSLRQILRAIETQLGRQRPSPQPGLCAIDIDAVGRWNPAFEVWDSKSYTAQYAALPLQDLALDGL